MERQKCPRCRVNLALEHFEVKRNGDLMKRCNFCRQKSAEYRNKNKCEHGRQKQACKECKGSRMCDHGKIKYRCKECGGIAFCEHGKRKQECKECGGNQMCEHGRRKCRCKECEGREICSHQKRRQRCEQCNFEGYLANIVSSQVYHALRAAKSKKSVKYLGCDIEEFKAHIEKQFEDGMTWENYGKSSPKTRKWEIDHITPLKYGEPTLEEVMERLHYTNTQPLWGDENSAKGNRYEGKPKR